MPFTRSVLDRRNDGHVDTTCVHRGRLVSVDSARAEAMPGAKGVVRLTEAVAVVADSYWHARTALAALKTGL